jgi:hypothetical protein
VGVEADHHVVQAARDAAGPLGDQQRLERPGPVAGHLQRHRADAGLHGLGDRPVAGVAARPAALDSAWLAKVTERGSLAGSFVPPEEIRRLRTHTRYRRKLVQMRTAQKERCEKLLEDAHLKLSSVISDVHGVSGRDMLRAIAAGERDPRALAEMARGGCHAPQDRPAGRGPGLRVLHP